MLDQLFRDIQTPEVQEPEVVQPSTPEKTAPLETKITVVEGESNTSPQETNTTTTMLPLLQSLYSEYPMESFKAIETGKSPGLTKEAPGKHNKLYKVNQNFLFGLEQNIAKDDVDYVFTAFSALNKKPIIGGKTVELSQIGQYMKTPAYRKKLMEQALELESDPSMSSEVRFALMKSHTLNIVKNGELLHARKLFGQEMLNVAKWAKYQKEYEGRNYFEYLIDENGNFRSKKDFNNLIAKRNQDIMATWEKDHPFPKNGPMMWQRTDMPNPMYGHVGPDGKMIDPRPKMENSQEGWYMSQDLLRQSLANSRPDYDEVKTSLLAAYDAEKSPVTKLRTNFESRYGGNKGGEIQGELATIDFDILNAAVAHRGKAILRPEIIELTNLFTLANMASTADNNVRVAFGKKTGNIPDKEISQNAQTVIKAVLEDLGSAAGRKKDARSRLPKGQITFSSIVAGGEPYYAYNIKFNNDYINTSRFKGTEKNQGPAGVDNNPELLTDGITIYVPAKIATGKMSGTNAGEEVPGHRGGIASRLATDNKKASTVSATEGLFTVTNDVQLRIPNGGQLNLTRMEDGTTHISGWNVVLNQNGKMDTIHLDKQLVPIDRATDLDWIVDDFFNNTYKYLDFNDRFLKELNKDKKVFDPNILKHTYQ